MIVFAFRSGGPMLVDSLFAIIQQTRPHFNLASSALQWHEGSTEKKLLLLSLLRQSRLFPIRDSYRDGIFLQNSICETCSIGKLLYYTSRKVMEQLIALQSQVKNAKIQTQYGLTHKHGIAAYHLFANSKLYRH